LNKLEKAKAAEIIRRAAEEKLLWDSALPKEAAEKQVEEDATYEREKQRILAEIEARKLQKGAVNATARCYSQTRKRTSIYFLFACLLIYRFYLYICLFFVFFCSITYFSFI
jgi:hypothetical protein